MINMIEQKPKQKEINVKELILKQKDVEIQCWDDLIIEINITKKQWDALAKIKVKP